MFESGAKIVSTYKKNILEGWQRHYYTNGVLAEKRKYREGKCIKYKVYYRTGKIAENCEKSDSMCYCIGAYQGYFPNGRLQYQGECSLGVGYTIDIIEGVHGDSITIRSQNQALHRFRKGCWLEYYSNGKILSQVNYYPGYFIKYDTIMSSLPIDANSIVIEGGTLIETVLDVKNGRADYYDSTGVLIKSELWLMGNLVK